jgi:PPOX class probable F420-dependent enzyme
MSKKVSGPDQDLHARILALLDESRVMSLATLRPDGWPQVTTVGYVHSDFVLYFAVASTSQKSENIRRDPRVSIAIARDPADSGCTRGLSMAARASQVIDLDEVEQINDLLAKRYPGQAMFAPRGASAVVLRAMPTIISLVDDSRGLSRPEVFHAKAPRASHRFRKAVPSRPPDLAG